MSIESVHQVESIWVNVGSFHTRLMIRFVIFTSLIRNIVDTPSYRNVLIFKLYDEFSNAFLAENATALYKPLEHRSNLGGKGANSPSIFFIPKKYFWLLS
jgi:hypothetical protein